MARVLTAENRRRSNEKAPYYHPSKADKLPVHRRRRGRGDGIAEVFEAHCNATGEGAGTV